MSTLNTNSVVRNVFALNTQTQTWSNSMNCRTIAAAIIALVFTNQIHAGEIVDNPDFSQSDFSFTLSDDGWTTTGSGVSGQNDIDGNSAIQFGFSGSVVTAQIASPATIAGGQTYYFQADFRLARGFNDDTWADGTFDDRDVTSILRYSSGGPDIFSLDTTISAAASATEWTTVRTEFNPGDLVAGNSIFLRFTKGDFGGGEEAIWIDNISFGTTQFVPEPSTALLMTFGLIGLAARRKSRVTRA